MASEVQEVLLGGKAQSAEAMMRARYSATVAKDAIFMAKTEVSFTKTDAQKVREWAVVFGREDAKDDDNNLETKLNSVSGFELIEATDTEVEYKISVEGGKFHQRIVFEEDEDLGYIYTGLSKKDDWVSDEEEQASAAEAVPAA